MVFSSRSVRGILVVALAAVCVSGVAAAFELSDARGAVRSGSAPRHAPTVRILSPGPDAIVSGRRLRVTIGLPKGVESLRVFAQRHNVSAAFHIHDRRASGMVPAADFVPGPNHITVSVRTTAGRGEAHVHVFAGRSTPSLLSARVTGTGVVSVAAFGPAHHDTVFHAYLNGRDVTHEFVRKSLHERMATLSATEGLHRGRNTLQLSLARRSTGAHDQATRTIIVGKNTILPATRRTGEGILRRPLRLDATPTSGAGRHPRLAFRWVVVSKPARSHARLRGASRRRPTLVPDKPGRYVIRLYVKQRLPRHARRDQAAAAAAAQPDPITRSYEVPPTLFTPWGESIRTLGQANGGFALIIGNTVTPNTEGTNGYFVADIDPATGLVDCQSGIPYGQEQALYNLLGSWSTAGSSCNGASDLIMIAAAPTKQSTLNESSTDIGYFNQAMAEIGASVPTTFIGEGGFSVIGIEGANSNAAWENLGGEQRTYGGTPEVPGSLIGRLMPVPPTHWDTDPANVQLHLTFVNSQYVPFNTASVSGSQTGISLSTKTPQFLTPPSNAGPGGIQVAVLDPHTLTPIATGAYCTAGPCGNDNTPEWELANLLGQYDGGQDIIILQTFGTVEPEADTGDGAIATAIRAMGGNPDLFNTFQGSYAFMYSPGHAQMEVSGKSTSDTTAAFNGLLGRDSQDRWYPVQTGLGGTPSNQQVPLIASEPATAFPFQHQSWLPGVEAYLEKHLNNLAIDNQYCPNNDCLRAAYWLSPGAIPEGSAVNGIPEPAPSTFGCTSNCSQEWQNILNQFSNEFTWVTKVNELFASWQQMLTLSEVNSGYDITDLADEIESYISYAHAKQATQQGKINEIYSIVNGVLNAASALGPITGAIEGGVKIGAGISATISVLAGGASASAPFATSGEEDYPALQGDFLASAATLGDTVNAQYGAMNDAMASLEEVILSDYGKLKQIGLPIQELQSGWELDNADNTIGAEDALRLSVRRYIYQQMLRDFVAPPGASHPRYPAYCAELGAADDQAILGSSTGHDGPGTNYAPHNHKGDAWYTFLITYSNTGGISPLGVTSADSWPDTSLSYPIGSSLFDTTGNNSTSIPAGVFAYSGQPTTVGSPSQLFAYPGTSQWVDPNSGNGSNNLAQAKDDGGLGFDVSEFWWDVFQPYGTYTSLTDVTGTC